jgi:hypothetical protein
MNRFIFVDLAVNSLILPMKWDAKASDSGIT